MLSIRRSIILPLLAALSLQTSAYIDHRNAHVDSLEAALASQNPPKGIDLLRAYDELMVGYLPYNSEKCEDYARKVLALSYKVNGLRVRQNALRHIGLLRYGHEKFDEALDYFRQALAVADTMATDRRYAQNYIDDARSALYGSIANVYNMQDKAHLAIHYYQLALPIFEKYDWLESQAICYYNIGELYGQMGNNDEAERNYLKAIEKGKASGDSLMIAIPKKGLVGIYFNTGDNDKALRTADEVLAYFSTHREEEPVDYATTLANKARILLTDGHKDVAKAKACVEEALPYIKDGMQFDDASTIYMAACEVAMAEKQWQKALDYGLRSVHPDSTATYADKGGYTLLAEIYTEVGQKEKARAYINKVYDMMNQYATDHYQSGLSQMEVLYETRQKEAQITALARERRQHLWVIGVGCLVLVVTVLLLFYFQLAHRRQKALLAAKVALETETKERRILARDLHDGLGGMLSVLRMKTEQGAEVLPLIDAIHTELRRTAHHLMPEELLKNGLVSALNDFAVSVPNARFQAVGDILLDKDKELVLYRCAYELVNNALKHADASHIDIQLMQEEKQVTLTVSDDGKGISPLPTSPNWGRKSASPSLPTSPNWGRKSASPSLPTSPNWGRSGSPQDFPPSWGDERGAGMGLQNIRERIEPYHGQLNIVTAKGKGTDINITLPIGKVKR